jgi:HEAT repeat protein
VRIKTLPAYIVLLSTAHAINTDQPLFSRLWSSGFLPSSYQGVRLRGGSTPVLYLDDPPGVDKKTRRQMLDAVAKLNKLKHDDYGDPEIETRIAQYEMAYRMQTSVPDLMDLSKEPDSVFEMYGPEARKPGTYAANCLLARRLAERGVRFIQLYHRGWDQHGDLPRDLALQCRGTDQPTAALVQDLKQRGLLDDTWSCGAGSSGARSTARAS